MSAALALVSERGYGGVTMDGIAAKAGVGKQTIYRWWPSRAAVMLEALRELAKAEIPEPDTGSFERDIDRFLTATFAVQQKRPEIVPLLRGLMAEAQLDPAFAVTLREDLIEPRRAALRSIFRRAKKRAELLPSFDIELGLDLAFGVLWYRILLAHAPLNRRAAANLADAIVRAASAQIGDSPV